MSLSTLELLSKMTLVGLDMLDTWDAVGINAERLRAERQRARDSGHAFGEAEVLKFFDQMGTDSDDLDRLLDVEEGDPGIVGDVDLGAAGEDTDPPATPV